MHINGIDNKYDIYFFLLYKNKISNLRLLVMKQKKTMHTIIALCISIDNGIKKKNKKKVNWLHVELQSYAFFSYLMCECR